MLSRASMFAPHGRKEEKKEKEKKHFVHLRGRSLFSFSIHTFLADGGGGGGGGGGRGGGDGGQQAITLSIAPLPPPLSVHVGVKHRQRCYIAASLPPSLPPSVAPQERKQAAVKFFSPPPSFLPIALNAFSNTVEGERERERRGVQ